MPTTESSMVDILVLKLLYLPCLWEFLISLFSLQLHSRMLCGVLRNSSNFLSPLFLRLPVSLPYTNSINLHFPLERHLCFQPLDCYLCVSKAHLCDIYPVFFPSAARSSRDFEYRSFLVPQPVHINSSGQCKSIWVLRTNCVEIPCNRDG